MRLTELCRDICAVPDGAGDREIVGLTADSRAVVDGMLFAALKGSRTNGAAFVPDAIGMGARAILVDTLPAFSPGAEVVFLKADEPRRALALMAARFHAPQPRTMVAVTGTAGKTSVASFVRQIFAAAGHRAASLGTVGVTVGAETRYGNLTTPDPVTLHRLLAELAAGGVTHAAMEASSHGLDQHRLDGVALKAAGFTNLGRDHLDYHPTMADYLAAKLRLFDTILPPGGTAVYNADMPEAEAIQTIARQRGQSICPVGERGTGIRVDAILKDGARQILKISGQHGSHEVVLPLAGTFQASNALIAAGLAVSAGVVAETAFAALESLEGAPGRLDFVLRTAGGADIYVDYAHKPDALRSALEALRPFAENRLWVVFGAGGDRDPGKRPLMAEAAVACADRVIVTDDNPRTEEPAAIRRAILDAAPDAIEIGDRGEAIRTALREAGRGDVVLVAGKGHETGQIVGETVLPFSDYDAIRRGAELARAS